MEHESNTEVRNLAENFETNDRSQESLMDEVSTKREIPADTPEARLSSKYNLLYNTQFKAESMKFSE
jgi:hypothetical protein